MRQNPKKRRIIKKTCKILTGLLDTMVILLLSLYWLISLPAVQSFAVDKAARFLSGKLQTTVSVGGVNFRLFNRIVLQDVFIADLQKDTLIHAGDLSAGVSIRNLIRNRIVFNELSLNKMSLRLTGDSVSGNNFQFILDAFKSDREPKNNLFLQFKSVKISDSRFRFEQLDRARKEAGLFDVNHLDFRNLNLNLRIDKLTNDTLSAEIKDITFDEQSGFSVRKMQALVQANTSRLTLNNFKIELPKTVLDIEKINLAYGNLQNVRYFTDSVSFDFSIARSAVSPGDLACFVPRFANFKNPVYLASAFQGKISDLDCPHLSISYGENFLLNGNFHFTGLPRINDTEVSAQISHLQFNNAAIETIVSEIRGADFALPDNLATLGMLRFEGNLRGNAAQLLSDGRLQTKAGTVNADLNLQFKDEWRSLVFSGNVGTESFNLGKLLQNEKVGNIVFNLGIEGNRLVNKPLSMAVKGSIVSFGYNNYTFHNILLDGILAAKSFNGSAQLRDDNGNVDFKGLIDFAREDSNFDFFARLQNVSPQKMKFTDKYPDLALSMLINTSGSTNAQGKLNSEAKIDSLVIKNKDFKWQNTVPLTLALQNFSLNEKFAYNAKSVVSLKSDFVQGKLEGYFTPAGMVADVRNFLSGYLPSLLPSAGKTQSQSNINFDFALFNTRALSHLINLPFTPADSTFVTGNYDKPNNNVALTVVSPKIDFNKKFYLSDLRLDLNNDARQNLELLMTFDSRHNPLQADSHLNLRSTIAGDAINAQLTWEKLAAAYRAELLTTTTFSRSQPENKLITDIAIEPGSVVLNDTVWNIAQSNVNITNNKITVNNFRLEHLGHSLLIDGTSTKGNENDGITVQLKDLYLRYLEMFAPMNKVALDGKVSGKVTLHNLREKFFFTSNLNAQNFSFNNSIWGDANVLGTWDKDNQNIRLAINVEKDSKSVLSGRGVIFPLKDSIELVARANGLKVDFLRPFLDNVVQNLSGEMYTDRFRLSGKTFNPYFDGKVLIKNGSLDVGFLRTSYFFNDSISIKKDEIRMDNVPVFDSEKNKGTLSGSVTHQRWKDFKYNIRLNTAEDMLVLNTRAQDNETFHGKVYGSGNVRISGDMNRVGFDIGLQNGNNSTLVIPLTGYSELTDNSFIHFVPKTPVDLLQKEGFMLNRSDFTVPSQLEMNLRIQADATPGGTVQLIVDPDAGDAITAKGSGSLTLEYNSHSGSMRMLGTYTIEQGTYNFTFRDIIRRNFRIRQGSTIQWSGSPYDAILNVAAYYTVTASLEDILGADGMGNISRRSVPVNCVMNITGNMQRPDIAFDIELPQSDEEVRRQVRARINSSDAMSQQFAMLLTIGRFMNPETNVTTILDRPGSEAAAVASSSISGQLNQWLSQMTNAVNVGVNYRPGNNSGTTGQEFDFMFTTELLDRRLIFNGNVGFRDYMVAGNPNRFVGDFDLEYKLNATGTWRAKAYSRTNDFTQLHSSTTTQGMGIMFTKRFDTFGSLFRRKETEK